MNESQEAGKVPVIKGWLNMDMEKHHLIGSRCRSCGEYYFPQSWICRNPECSSVDLEEAPISKRGTIWSHTLNHYEPPAPYKARDNFEPYAIIVAELPKEKLMIMGPLADGFDYSDLKIGMDVDMVFETLQHDENGNELIIWKWKPLI